MPGCLQLVRSKICCNYYLAEVPLNICYSFAAYISSVMLSGLQRPAPNLTLSNATTRDWVMRFLLVFFRGVKYGGLLFFSIPPFCKTLQRWCFSFPPKQSSVSTYSSDSFIPKYGGVRADAVHHRYAAGQRVRELPTTWPALWNPSLR